MFKSISSMCSSIMLSKRSINRADGQAADGVLAKIRKDVSILKDQRLWQIFRMCGYVTLCIGTGFGGILAAVGLLVLVFLIMWPFFVIGSFVGGLTSWIGSLMGMDSQLWMVAARVIAISPAIVILRIVLPLWWRLISLRIVSAEPADIGKDQISNRDC